eukprot:403332924
MDSTLQNLPHQQNSSTNQQQATDLQASHSKTNTKTRQGQAATQIEEGISTISKDKRDPNSQSDLVERTSKLKIERRKHNELEVQGKNEDIQLTRNTQQEIQQRVFYKAKRSQPSGTPNTNGDSLTSENSAIGDLTKQKPGQFKLNGSISQNGDKSNLLANPQQMKFQFSFQNPASQTNGKDKIQDGQQNNKPNPFSNPFSAKPSQAESLKSEQKFVVNKDLFSNPFIKNPFSTSQQPHTQDQVQGQQNPRNSDSNLNSSQIQAVQEIPFNSTVSLNFQKKLSKNSAGEESPQIKSLFDFQENARYKRDEDDDKAKTEIVATQNKSFDFAANFKNPFSKPANSNSDNSSDMRGVTIKPPVFQAGNPFKIPGSTSNLFTSGKSLFDVQNVKSAAQKWQPPTASQNSDSNIKYDEEEEEKLQPDVKDGFQNNSLFIKVFQRQILKLKTIKGVSSEERKPSTKGEGFLSIEKYREQPSTQTSQDDPNSAKPQPHYLVYRNFLGATQFTSLIVKNQAKIRELNEKPNKFQVKIAVSVRNPTSKKYEQEHVKISFITDAERQMFINLFKEVANVQ